MNRRNFLKNTTVFLAFIPFVSFPQEANSDKIGIGQKTPSGELHITMPNQEFWSMRNHFNCKCNFEYIEID